MSFFKPNYKPANESYQYPLSRSFLYPDIELVCDVHFSNRKSITIQIKEDLTIHVRAPLYTKPKQVNTFIESHKSWIYEKWIALKEKIPVKEPLSPSEMKRAEALERKFRKAAKEYIPYRVEYFHQFTGGNYTSITIRDQKSRWGSCSSRGTLSFNYRLMMAPTHILDYVVVHELCHLTHMNHSKEFWSMVESIIPDYKECKKWLKEHGNELSIEAYLAKYN
ncbi:MAG: M48 family metallopeptidase [Lachnospiraceae bacterium]|nr:M48 family metallopeptidase [Lachnospiraceae bacterium]MBQ9123147.1 M48 family metallopeptidase [Lachnospiraceae bacterium]